MNRVLALLAFAVLAGFLLILVIGVPHIDLIGIVALTAILAGYDLLTASGKDKG